MKIFLSDRKSILQHNLRQKRLFATCSSKPLYIDVGFYRPKAAKPPYIASSSTRHRRISRSRKPSISRSRKASISRLRRSPYHAREASISRKPQGFPYHAPSAHITAPRRHITKPQAFHITHRRCIKKPPPRILSHCGLGGDGLCINSKQQIKQGSNDRRKKDCRNQICGLYLCAAKNVKADKNDNERSRDRHISDRICGK